MNEVALSFAHEVANPLNGMFMQVQLLRREATASGCDARVLDRITALVCEIERLNRLLAEFRTSSRVETRRPCRRIDVPWLLEQSLRFVVIDPRIDVQMSVASVLPALGGSADQLQQVFVNLLKNAVEAMPEGGTLSVRATSDQGRVFVEIGDTGVGLHPDVRGSDASPSRKAGGRGRGLSIVAQLLFALGGTLGLSSVAGVGTTMTVMLPIGAAESVGGGHL